MRFSTLLATGLLLGATQSTWAQGPVVTTRSPARHALAAPVAGPVTVNFSQAVTAASAPELRIYGSQRGRWPGTVSGGGTSSLRFAPAVSFAPGEQVSVTVPPTLLGTTGTAASRQVYQFRAAAGGTGRGVFVDTTEVGYANTREQLLGDLDHDGDLDLVTLGGFLGGFVYSNNGTGSFAKTGSISIAQQPRGGVLADFNQDGYLDLLVGDAAFPQVGIAFNDGQGGLGVQGAAQQPVAVGGVVAAVAAGDLDGDGDLDVVAMRASGTAILLLNDGTGLMGSPSAVPVAFSPSAVQLGDVDNDGDLDMVVSDRSANNVGICLNNGRGVFTGVGQTVAVGTRPADVALADIDGDGDLDLLTANETAGSYSVSRNAGPGTFGAAQTTALTGGGSPNGLTLGDVDADGDLDLLVAQGSGGTVFTLLNNGQGTFTAQANQLVLAADYTGSRYCLGVALGDVDNDGDLDVLTTNTLAQTGRAVLGRNNALPSLLSFSPTSGAPGTQLTLTGTNLTGALRVTFGGSANNVVTTGFVVNAAGTQITGVVVPAGALSGPLSVTTRGGGTVSSASSFTVPTPLLVVSQGGTSYGTGGTYQFGSQGQGQTSAPVQFTLSNIGAVPLQLSSVGVSGSGFALVSTAPTTVAAGGSVAVGVTFTPGSLGAQTGTLTLVSNSGGSPTFVLQLAGTGVVPRPVLTALNPASTWVGSTIALGGSYLTNASVVQFTGPNNSSLDVTSGFTVDAAGTQITGVVVPNGAVTGPVKVLTPGGASAPLTLTVVLPPPPVLTSFSPTTPYWTGPLTITGNYLQNATAVFVSGGSYTWTFRVVDSHTIEATVPQFSPASGTLYVTTPGGTSNGLPLQLRPYLSKLTPAAGYVGETFTIGGMMLGGDVRLNGIPVTYTSDPSGSSLTATVPPGATSGPVTVTANGIAGNPLPFTVTQRVELTDISPRRGPAGTVLTLTGTNLQGTSAIVFPGSGINTVTSGFMVNAAGTQITGVVVPPGAATGEVNLVTPNGSSNHGADWAHLFTVSSPAAALLPSWQTLTYASQRDGNMVLASAPGPGNTLYLLVGLYGQVDFAGQTLGVPPSGTSNPWQSYLLKYDPATGLAPWALYLGAGDLTASGLAVQGNNVYVSGGYGGFFTTVSVAGVSLTSRGNSDLFIAKITDTGPAGSVGWVWSGGGPGYDVAGRLVAPGNSLYLTGTYTQSFTVGGTTLPNTGGRDCFVLKLTEQGSSPQVTWAVPYGGSGEDSVSGLALSGSSVYVSGTFTSPTCTFGTLSLSQQPPVGSDGYLAKLTDTGPTAAFTWVQALSGPENGDLGGVVATGTTLYVSGQYQNTVNLGATTIGSPTAYGGTHAFVAKLVDAGSTAPNPTWVQRFSNDAYVEALTAGTGGVYVGLHGQWGSQVGNLTIPQLQSTPVLLIRLRDDGATGTCAWVQVVESSYANSTSLATLGNRVLLSGYISLPATFAPLTATGSSSYSHAFVASLTDNTLLAVAPAAPLPGLLLYPNPAHASATVWLPAPATTATLTLYDLPGRRLRTQVVAVPAAGLAHELPLAGLIPGIYLLHVATPAGTATRRLVVE